MSVKIREGLFDPWLEVQQYQEAADAISGKFGATSIFIGTMRDFNDGNEVKGMALEHYPGMTEKELEKIVAKACQLWHVIDTLVIHRVGDILPGEPIVLVSVWASHRGDAFDANRFIMEELKSNAPFWKKELLQSEQSRWVAHNTDGYKPVQGS